MGYKNLSTSRGDGNENAVVVVLLNELSIRTYLPREGTETYQLYNA